ncbi:carbon-nitrogen hydrolase family protein [Micromonospora wenchangensis]|uniref:carbon-nitrogen hydrolase family protein n=1 Tax=Micromonospora wenchangensis TaxID=1185415 RepID=UPI003D766581
MSAPTLPTTVTAPGTPAGSTRTVVPDGDGPGGLPVTPLRLTVVQARAVPGQVATNSRRAADGALRAARRGARLIVLPELHVGGYHLPGVPAAAVPADDAGAVTDHRLAPLAEVAATRRVTVLVGAAVRHPDGRLTNSVLVADPAGIRVGYDKQHLWQDEATVFTRGRSAGTLTVDGWRIGLGVCYDMSFPEHARASALAGGHVYLAASAFAAGTEHRAGVYLAARALENTVYTAFVNPVGGPPERPCRGGSALWGPDGRRLGVRRGDREGMLSHDLDPAELARVRGFLRMLAQVRAG